VETAVTVHHWPEETERAVLSAILFAGCIDADAGLRVLRKARGRGLHPSDFGLASYGFIFEAMLRLEQDGLPVDPVSVAAELDSTHSDPRAVARLHVLAREHAVFTAIERYADIVVQAAGRRETEERAS
jgi:replicative DNA helicase